MPLFSSKKFSPKKAPPRKSGRNVTKTRASDDNGEFNIDVGKIGLEVGEQQIMFEDGEWIPENGAVGNKHKENQKLKQRIQQLEEENNFLQLKTEVLLDMLTETTAEAHIQDKEITRLRQQLSRTTST